MTDWNPQNIHPSMRVYTLDGHELGHIAKVYEDSFLVHKGYFFPTDRYIPYSAIDSVENDRVQLSMSADEAKQKEWEKRPDGSVRALQYVAPAGSGKWELYGDLIYRPNR